MTLEGFLSWLYRKLLPPKEGTLQDEPSAVDKDDDFVLGQIDGLTVWCLKPVLLK